MPDLAQCVRRRRLRRVAARVAVPAVLLAPHVLDRVPVVGALLGGVAPGIRYLLLPVLLAELLVLWTVDGRPLPNGDALPCHAARVIPSLVFDNVKNQSLGSIWQGNDAFQRFRGESWMQEPCRSCARRLQDFGGCRCQALLLAGNASATDPVCSLSPDRAIVDAALRAINPAAASPAAAEWRYRSNPF